MDNQASKINSEFDIPIDVYQENLDDFKNEVSKKLYGKTIKEAIESERCIQCDGFYLTNCYSKAGIKEFFISGLCEICFDKITLRMEGKTNMEDIDAER